jgi:hypothetical protein
LTGAEIRAESGRELKVGRLCQGTADVKGDSTWGAKVNVGGIDGAFQPLSTTIVQTIAEFVDADMVRIWGTRRSEPYRR